jgi:exocyst complex component 2
MHCIRISESVIEANKLFDEVLARRDRADATRNALGVLQRFKFLFSLPVSIERNIRKGDYDVVINDYARAKNLFSNTDVAVSVFSFFIIISSFAFLRVEFEKNH